MEVRRSKRKMSANLLKSPIESKDLPVSIKLRRITIPKNGQSDYVHSSDTQDPRKWHQKIYDQLRKTNLLEVLEDGNRIFNMKEANFSLDPVCHDKSTVSTLVIICASGEMVNPIVFYPFNGSQIASDNDSYSPFNENDNLLEYMKDIFLPWLISNDSKFPIIVFYDYDPKSVSCAVISFCKMNQILFIRILPAQNLHPIKSVVLPHLQNAWTAELHKWNSMNENLQLTNDLFRPLLRQVFAKTITVDLLKIGFSKCGIFPFNPEAAFYNEVGNSTLPTTLSPAQQNSIQPASQFAPQQCIQRTSNTTNTTLLSATQPTLQNVNFVAASNERTTIASPSPSATSASQQTMRPTSQSVPQPLIRPAIESSQSTPQSILQDVELNQPLRLHFEEVLGPILHEFKNPRNWKKWTGAIENKSLFEMWVSLPNSHSSPPTTFQEIDSKPFLMQYQGLLGPLLYEFRNSGNVWKGAIENTALFEVWQSLLKSSQSPPSTTSPVLFRDQIQDMLGPLKHEFRNFGSVWNGAIENTALFGVWKCLQKSGR